jgi:hypothetical protein
MLRLQAEWCARLGSPLYGVLCARVADDVEAGGPAADVLAGHEEDRPASALALRLMGAVHRLALAGEAPALARHYPSAGGDGDAEDAWEAFRAVLAERRDDLRVLVERGVQTNEVGRAAALAPGFLTVAQETGLPLRILEMGTSAGLNLRWDCFRYEASGETWGDPRSPVVLRDAWETSVPPFAVAATVAERAGCDPSPVDPTTDEGRLTLMSYVWPDQRERFAMLRGAIEVARRVPAEVERASAVDWLPVRLARARPGTATVVFHSIALQYLDRNSREEALGAIADAGARAPAEAPVAWLRMEPGGEQAEVRLTLWPGGHERLVATTGFHGRPVRWLG